jgi:drug/metabolite transporter (DMT)-like permease
MGAAVMLAAALFMTAMALVTKVIGPQTTVWHVALARFGLGALFMVALARMAGFGLWGSHRRLLLIRGTIGTVAFFLLTKALFTLPVAAVMVLFQIYPIWAAILAPWVNREPVSAGDWVLIVLAILGAALILWPEDMSLGFNYLYLFPLAASLCAGMVVVLLRRLRADNNPLTLYFYMCLAGAVMSVVPVGAMGRAGLPAVPVLGGLALVALLSGIGQIFMNHGFKYLTAPRGGAMMTSQVLMGAAAGLIWFDEAMSVKFVIGALMILTSVVLLTLRPTPPKIRVSV